MNAPSKILVVALDNLGDAVMASAVLAPLKKSFPGAVVGLWVKQYTAGLFEAHSFVDHLHAADPFWDASPGLPSGGAVRFFSTINNIRARGYDTALLLNTEWRRSLAALVAGIPRRIGYDRRHSRIVLTQAVPVAALVQHFVDDHRILLEQGLGISAAADDCVSRLAVAASEKTEFESWRLRNGVDPKKYWIAHFFSGDPLKNWPIDRWLALLSKARSCWPDQRAVVLLGPSEEKKLMVNQLDILKQHAVLLKIPTLGLLKAVLANATVAVDGDSGPGHVAAALQTPVVSLFGATNPLRSRPIGTGPTRIVSARAVVDIAVENVWAAMNNISPEIPRV